MLTKSFLSTFLKVCVGQMLGLISIVTLIAVEAPSASAQVEMRQGLAPFTEVVTLDQNGVDIASGFSFFQLADVGIGTLQHVVVSRPGRLEAYYSDAPLIDNFTGFIYPVHRPGRHNTDCAGGAVDAMIGNSAKLFCDNSNGTYAAHVADGSTLVRNPDNSYIYTDSGGSKYTFSPNLGAFPRLSGIEYADGRRANIYFKTATVKDAPGEVNTQTYYRIQSVVQSDGYQLKYLYNTNSTTTYSDIRGWLRPYRIFAVNNAVDYCSPIADSCNFSTAWRASTYIWSASAPYEECTTDTDVTGDGGDGLDPEITPITYCQTYSDYTYINITNSAGLTVKYTMDIGGRVIRVEQPDGRLIEYQYCMGMFEPGVDCAQLAVARTGFGVHHNKVISVNNDGNVWNYNYIDRGLTNQISEHDYGSTPPAGLSGGRRVYSRAYNNGPTASYVQRITSDNGVIGYFAEDISNRIVSLTQPDTFDEAYQYDSRGNVVKIIRTGVGVSPIVLEAGYDSTCTNQAKCNKPNWMDDALGNRTEFTYYPTGLIKSVTSPANAQNTRPQVRYFYEQRYAYTKGQSGNYVRAQTPIWMLIKESYCISGQASGDGCLNSSDEVITTYEYGPAQGPNNLLLRGVAVTTRDGTRRTCYTYDAFSNKSSETGSRANLPSCP